ncbi:hypothetical protein WEH80_22060 [Actinomycetes bacterium KLBMP 9759]
MTAADQACHDLLVRLAGRLPDELLWRLRDWLAAEGRAAVSAMLPRELLRHRIGLSEDEREMLFASVGEWGASPRVLDAVLPQHVPDDPAVSFHASKLIGKGDVDQAALSVLAVVRGHPGCVELRQTWRGEGRKEQRVVLVLGADRPWTLTGTLQRVLRAHGDRTPCVEVLPPHGEANPYHRAAIIESAPLWRSPAMTSLAQAGA